MRKGKIMKKISLTAILILTMILTSCGKPSDGKGEPADSLSVSVSDQKVQASDFVGEWECDTGKGHALLAICKINGEYDASIFIGDSYDAHEQWEYPLRFIDGKMVCSGKGLKSVSDQSNLELDGSDYDLSKSMSTFPDQSAEFLLSPDGVIWKDLTDTSRGEVLFKFFQSIEN